MNITDEKISAFLDGELSADETAILVDALEKDSNLSRRIEQLSTVDRVIHAAYSNTDNTPLPDSVLALIQTQNMPSSILDTIKAQMAAMFAQKHYWPATLAASIALVFGIGLGNQLKTETTSPQQLSLLVAGMLAEESPLAVVLETARSANTIHIEDLPVVAITPVLTFRSSTGNYCREFTLVAQDSGNRAVACRNEQGWIIEMVVTDTPARGDSGIYSTASTTVTTAFDGFVDGLIGDAPLGVDAELSLITSGWSL